MRQTGKIYFWKIIRKTWIPQKYKSQIFNKANSDSALPVIPAILVQVSRARYFYNYKILLI